MKRNDLLLTLVRMVPHATVLAGCLVAWLAFRGGIEWGAPWGVLGAILTLWHVIVRAMHVDTFVGSSLLVPVDLEPRTRASIL